MGGYFKELFSMNVYKKSQGRYARMWTSVGIALVFLFGAFSCYSAYGHTNGAAIAAAIIAILGLWIAFRTVNYPTFADFLVSVEAEMSKVSWPTMKELYVNSKVVLVFMALFTILIFIYDIVFRVIFGLFT